jgi:hypothetical protein
MRRLCVPMVDARLLTMSAEIDDDPAPGGWFARRTLAIDPPGETPDQRLTRGRSWTGSSNPKERSQGLSVLGILAPGEAVDAAVAALHDSDKHVRVMSLMVLLGDGGPSPHGDRIVTELGGEHSTAEWFVQMHPGPGLVGSFGLTERLLAEFDEIARSASRRKDRKTAAAYARALREHSPGWPLQ